MPTTVRLRLSPLVSRHYILLMKKQFNGCALSAYANNKNLTLVGTMKTNKTKIPPEFLPSRKRSVESSSLMSLKRIWQLCCCPACTMMMPQVQNKSLVFLDYNVTKGGVDTAEQLIRTYSVLKKVNRRCCCSKCTDHLDHEQSDGEKDEEI